MRLLLSFLIGLIFGLGLVVSGMNLPSKVQGFLDVAGLWDPSLAFVMIGAIGVATIAFRLAKRRRTSFIGDPIQTPAASRVDARLVVGAAIFGVGWGLSGVCPGPATVNLALLDPKAVVFFVAMVLGMAAERMGPLLARASTPTTVEQDG